MLYSPASSRGKKFPQIEFGIQWLLPAFRINVTISLNLAANYNLGGEAQSFPFESLSQSFYFCFYKCIQRETWFYGKEAMQAPHSLAPY